MSYLSHKIEQIVHRLIEGGVLFTIFKVLSILIMMLLLILMIQNEVI